MDREPINLDWLAGKKWDELEPWERRLIEDSQTEHIQQGVYIPNSAVSNLIELLHDHGVINAADIDVDLIRNELGIEHTQNPVKIETAIERLESQRVIEAYEYERETCLPILLQDVINELEVMKREEEIQKQLERDVDLLELVGIDPRQLEDLMYRGKIGHDELRALAKDLRSSLASDIAQDRIKKNARRRILGKRPDMYSYEDIFSSVTARKMREARRHSELMEGQDRAIKRLVIMFADMKTSERGREELLKIQQKALESSEGRELLQAVWQAEQVIAQEQKPPTHKDLLFDLGDEDWSQN